jgi:hypothetical protein
MAVGFRSLSALTTGYGDAAFGNLSMANNSTGFHDTALGFEALEYNTTGNSNTAVGEGALWQHVTGDSNTSVGLDSMVNDIGSGDDTAVGQGALYFNTSSAYNTAIGHQTMYDNVTGSENSALGNWALYLNTTGSYNTAVGHKAGSPSLTGNGNTTGTYNSYFGAESGPGSSLTQYTYQTDIGAGSVGSCSNCVVLGRALDAAQIPGTLSVGTTSSKVRFEVVANAGEPAAIFNGDSVGHGMRVGTSDYVFGGTSGSILNFALGAGTGNTFGEIDALSNGGAASNALILQNNKAGEVGIGTTTPKYRLDVAGAIRSSTGGIVFPDGTIQITAFNPTLSASNAITQANGDVGIGTTTPTTALSVYAHPGQPAAVFYTDESGRGLRVGTSDYVFGGLTGTFMNLGMAAGTGVTTGTIQVQSGGANENLAIEPNGGNVGIGTTTPGAALEVDGNVKLTSGSGASIMFQDGTVQSTAYTGVTSGGDYAESVNVGGERSGYEPGDVLVIDPTVPGKFLESNSSYSTLVAGIYSTKPGTVGRRQSNAPSADEVPMALVGIVPVKVSSENGSIRIGDLLVSSSMPGRAMRGTDRERMTGAVIGKALRSLDSGTGTIETLVMLQ